MNPMNVTYIGNCPDCKHYVAPKLISYFPEEIKSERSCTSGNVDTMKQWWVENGTKREAKSFCRCFEAHEMSILMLEMQERVDRLIDLLKD